MSGSRRQRDSLAPSLFPFLAVLLCTMGALVLILMLIVAGAQSSAKEVAQDTSNRVEEAEALLEHAKQAFEKQLVEGRVALEKKRLVLQHIESHIQELLDELEDLKRTAELVEQDKSADGLEDQDRQEAITALEKQLAEATQELEKKLEKPDGDKPIFAIIPYQGTNGTHRRPIYLECTEEGVVVQPEGVMISPEDLRPPYGPGNPLDAALRTVRNEFPPSNGAVTSTAYPLLIVRPSGVRTYALARAAMSGWDDQFGYELIDEALELTFPESLPGLDNKLSKALDLARERQAALVMAMPNKYRGRGAGDDLDFDPMEAEWGEGRPGGEGGLWGNGSAGNNSSGSQSGGQSSGMRGGYGLAGDASSPAGEWSADRPGVSEGAGAGFAAGDFAGGSAGSSGGQRQSSDPSSLFSQGSAGSSADPWGANSGAKDGNFDQGMAPADMLAMNGLRPSGNSGAAGGDASWAADGASQETGGQFTNDRSTNDQGGQAGASGGGGSQASASGRQFELPMTTRGSSGSGSQASNSQTNDSQSANSSSASGATASDSGSNASSANEQAGMSPQLTLNRDLSKNNESAQPVARSRGRGWAWSRGPQTETPVVRSIRLQCLNDKWLIMPDRGSTLEPTVISFESSPRQRAEKLAGVVQERVEGWGLALTGGYWKPVLVVEVAPDAKWRYDQLQQLLDGSGLEVQLQAERNTTIRR